MTYDEMLKQAALKYRCRLCGAPAGQLCGYPNPTRGAQTMYRHAHACRVRMAKCQR